MNCPVAGSRTMNQKTAAESDFRATETWFKGPVRRWELVFLAVFTASVLLAIWVQSKKDYFNYDELVTAILVSNPSFSEMWNTIRHGGEVNPPLFFTLEWLAARVWGTSEIALRAISAVAMVLAGWVLFFTLRPLSGPRIAALTVALILGVSREVLACGAMARYYGV